MTLANKITAARILAVPFLVIALLEGHMNAARGLFIACVASDALDGAIARWRGERTPLGTFLDPLADKILILATFLSLAILDWVHAWVFVAVLSRDLLIVLGWSVVRILTGNSRIEPRPLGKLTTGLQMAVVIAKLFGIGGPLYLYLFYAMMMATLVSAGDYVWVGNKRLGALE